MRIAGIIAEYNPFHNGHALHVRLTRASSACDYVVAVMSGAFTQRGEPALCDKWTRARMALRSGVDLVVELPALFATRPAPQFALGGVSLLAALGIDVLSFGTELDDLNLLTRMAVLLNSEPPELSTRIKARLAEGQSHARARGEALAELLDLAPQQVNAPNTALALEYLRANLNQPRPMQPLAIHRVGDYHGLDLGPIASASAVRKAVREGNMQSACISMPEPAFTLLDERQMAAPDALDSLLLYRLRAMDAAALARLPDVAEGLEMRILRIAQTAPDRARLMRLVKCKRYTMARISRVLTYALLELDAALADAYAGGAPYARVLGFREDARPLIRHLQQLSTIPIVTDPARIKREPCFALERRATDLWGLATAHAPYRVAGRDMTQRVVIE